MIIWGFRILPLILLLVILCPTILLVKLLVLMILLFLFTGYFLVWIYTDGKVKILRPGISLLVIVASFFLVWAALIKLVVG